MRIYTKAGDLAFSAFTFPDGQPHFKLETYEREFSSATVETGIKSPLELLQTALAVDVLRQSGYSEVNLDIRYLMGARMDRAIDSLQPFTLRLVAATINSWGLNKVRVLDVHSEVATRLIRNSSNVLPTKIAQQALASSGASVIVAPDAGASYRAQKVWEPGRYGTTIIYCEKHRDPETGTLSRFKVNNYEPDKDGTSVMIVDDICDGGATFVGLAGGLRRHGAKKVFLYVTHGIFSKGLPLEGIDQVYTTDSYADSVYDKPMGPRYAVTIPISMKEL